MEAIIRHSPIARNGPIYSIYGNGRFPVAVYRTCCAKGSKAQSMVCRCTCSKIVQAHHIAVGGGGYGRG